MRNGPSLQIRAGAATFSRLVSTIPQERWIRLSATLQVPKNGSVRDLQGSEGHCASSTNFRVLFTIVQDLATFSRFYSGRQPDSPQLIWLVRNFRMASAHGLAPGPYFFIDQGVFRLASPILACSNSGLTSAPEVAANLTGELGHSQPHMIRQRSALITE
jgi:hypothetical protein